MQLKLWIRQNPIVNLFNQQIYYDGTTPTNLQGVVGILPQARQWPSYNNFIDVTQDCSDLFKINLQWSEQKDNEGNTIPGSNQVKKGVAGTISITGESYRLIKKWLIDDISAPFNQVEVKIEDVGCGFYEGYVIKSSDLTYCESGFCQFDLNIKQRDQGLECIKKTVINDNWQGWFPDDGVPLNGKKHPRFSYCNEVRPNGTLILQLSIFASTFATNIVMTFLILITINPILFILNAIENILGQNWGIPGPLNLGDMFAGAAASMLESSGCGREHPSILIRDYISNVCDKCGIGYDPITIPIFFGQTITIETSDQNRGNNGIITTQNPHFWATYFYAPAKRGIRRFGNLSLALLSPGFTNQNTNQFWIPENAPNLALDQFLDQLKEHYNAEWRIRNGMLYFWRKDWFKDGAYLYDFSLNGADRNKILEGICFETNEVKQPATCYGLYQTDGADSNEAGGGNGNGQMNGIVSFVNNSPNTLASALVDNNPSYEGTLDKTTGFGATKFRLDGASTDYLYDALQVCINAAVATFLTGIPGAMGALFSLYGEFRDLIKQYADYALLLRGETAALPKILIWDQVSYLNASTYRPKAAWDGVAPQPMPDINPVYNVTPEQWKERHEPQTKVLGKLFQNNPNGIYLVTNLLGITYSSEPALLVNYPMYFEPYYYDTMWDWFHWIDDPRRNPTLNQSWSLKMDLCCEDLNKLGVLNDASNIELGRRVKGTNSFYPDMKIEDILVSYDNDDTYGKFIQLSGTL